MRIRLLPALALFAAVTTVAARPSTASAGPRMAFRAPVAFRPMAVPHMSFNRPVFRPPSFAMPRPTAAFRAPVNNRIGTGATRVNLNNRALTTARLAAVHDPAGVRRAVDNRAAGARRAFDTRAQAAVRDSRMDRRDAVNDGARNTLRRQLATSAGFPGGGPNSAAAAGPAFANNPYAAGMPFGMSPYAGANPYGTGGPNPFAGMPFSGVGAGTGGMDPSALDNVDPSAFAAADDGMQDAPAADFNAAAGNFPGFNPNNAGPAVAPGGMGGPGNGRPNVNGARRAPRHEASVVIGPRTTPFPWERQHGAAAADVNRGAGTHHAAVNNDGRNRQHG
jgi:hypothetical protein